jgi:hypothetical protein
MDLVKIQSANFKRLSKQWSFEISQLPEEFPSIVYEQRLSFINPEKENLPAYVNPYALVDKDRFLVVALISSVHIKNPKGYIKAMDILFCPELFKPDQEIHNVIMTEFLFNLFKLSNGEMKTQKIKVYGSSEQANIFSKAVINHQSDLVSQGIETKIDITHYGQWLEFTKKAQ